MVSDPRSSIMLKVCMVIPEDDGYGLPRHGQNGLSPLDHARLITAKGDR